MYDEQNHHWEIVDGLFNEVNDTNLDPHEDNLGFFLTHLLQSKVSEETKFWFETLVDAARSDEEYTLEVDQSIYQLEAFFRVFSSC
ncbi:hypothetical protein [Legionella sp. PC997]|uniref:hypothetical protein n=1 Tax=Legionella sp. PC997 TaxID=2755562 RepID=UPI0015FCEEA2|nr:hypothetical protein [Legionella sp. PC997]QMT60461.1 hypothetical protein HBNCFIEN_01833 [Legionella sp. PC997]